MKFDVISADNDEMTDIAATPLERGESEISVAHKTFLYLKPKKDTT
jgi:hypothetical protein